MFDLHTASSTFCCTVDIDELYYARPKVVHRYRKLLNLVESCRSLLESVDITKYNVVKICQILLRIVDHNRHVFIIVKNCRSLLKDCRSLFKFVDY